MALFVLCLSLLLQIGAVILALRLMKVTGPRVAWALIAAAIFLMAIRRCITLARIINGDTEHPPDLFAESVALVISVLLVVGIYRIFPLFRSVVLAKQEVQQLLESTPDAMIVADEEGTIVDVNAQAVRLFDYPRRQLVGSHVARLVPERFAEMHGELYGANPRPRSMGAKNLLEARTKDGRAFPVEISVNPFESSRGRLVVSAIRDVSARRAAEDKVKKSEAGLRSLLNVLDSSSVATSILDADFRVVWVNRAYESFFGVVRGDVVGEEAERVVRERIEPLFDDGAAIRDKILAVYANNAYVETFEGHVHNSGVQERWLEHWSRPIETGLYKGGRIEHYADVTERKLAEERIRLFVHIARNMQVGLLVYRLDDMADDRSLRVVTINPEGEQLLGIDKDELLGKRIDEALPALRPRGIPPLFAEVLRTGEAAEMEDFDYGDDRVLKKAWSFKAFPLPDQCVGVVFESITEQKSREELIRNLAAGVAADRGEAFFHSLVRYLAKSLGLEYALVGELTPDGASVRTVAVYDHGRIGDNLTYPLAGTPCANVVGHQLCVHERDVQQRFPEDVLLKEMNVESYVGSPLFGSHGQPLGLIAVLGERPLENPETARSVLKIFAASAAAEVERQRASV